MRPIYKENEETLEISEEISSHISLHLHKSMELQNAAKHILNVILTMER